MKYIVYAAMLIPLGWGMVSIGTFPPFGTFGTGTFSAMGSSFLVDLAVLYASPLWGVALFYLYDFAMAMLGRNSPFMTEFYGELKTELMNAILGSVSLATLFFFMPSTYSLSNIDVAGAGLPFFISAVTGTVQCRKLKVAGNTLPARIVAFMTVVQLVIYGVGGYALLYVLSEKATPSQSLWIQLTFVCAALAFYFGTKQLRFFFDRERMELSPILVRLFEQLPASPGIYRDMQRGSEIWNREVRKAKALMRREARARSKHKRK
jgi:hypothetical protein